MSWICPGAGRVRELGQRVGQIVGRRVNGQRVQVQRVLAKSFRVKEFLQKKNTSEPRKGSTRGPAKDVTGDKIVTTAFKSKKMAPEGGNA